MSNNQELIKIFARQLPKIDVYGVCTVWNGNESSKINTLAPKRTDDNSCLKDICGVWKNEESKENLAIQTRQTLQEQNDIWDNLGLYSSKTAVFEDKKALQTHQTSKSDNIHKENLVVNESKHQVSVCAIDRSHYIGNYNERAAILEYDGKLSRAEAEHRSFYYTLEEYLQHLHPEILNTFNSIVNTDITNQGISL